MRLALLGGGGFRVPLVYGALLRDTSPRRIDEVVLHDVDETRLAAISLVLAQLAVGHDEPPRVRTTTVLDDALRDAAFVFSAIRVGGLEGRTADERVALDLGLLGQETTGPGGVAYGLRTVPVAVSVAERVAELAPDAWVVNFTNPAGMVTEAMQRVLGDRVVGICDTPVGLARRAAEALGLDAEATTVDYAGLNHLGWLRGLRYGGRDVLPGLLDDDAALDRLAETRLFGADWIRTLGAVPNEYLYYYYCTREAVAAIRGGPETRGEFLLGQQQRFYAGVAASPATALQQWRRVQHERDATYLSEARPDREARQDVEPGGYEGVALAVMAAIARNERAAVILDVRNAGTLPGLPADAVVEVPCTVDANGAHPLVVSAVEGSALEPSALAGSALGLVQQVKAVERLTIDAALTGSARTAVAALALHPLVDSVPTAHRLLDGYRTRLPALGELLR